MDTSFCFNEIYICTIVRMFVFFFSGILLCARVVSAVKYCYWRFCFIYTMLYLLFMCI